MDPIYFLRIRHGLDMIRIAKDGLSIEKNDFNHSDWNLDPSVLPVSILDKIRLFCVAEGILSPNWSALATRHFNERQARDQGDFLL